MIILIMYIVIYGSGMNKNKLIKNYLIIIYYNFNLVFMNKFTGLYISKKYNNIRKIQIILYVMAVIHN